MCEDSSRPSQVFDPRWVYKVKVLVFVLEDIDCPQEPDAANIGDDQISFFTPEKLLLNRVKEIVPATHKDCGAD